MAKSIYKAFGKAVREAREAKGLSQLKLAEKADMHLNTIGMIERGERGPSFEALFRLSHALGSAPSKLILSTELAQCESVRRPK